MQTLQCFSKSLKSIGINNFDVDYDISSTQKYTFARYMKGKLYLNLKCKILTRFLAGVSHVNFEPKEFAYLNITRIGSQLVRKDIECGFACLEITSCFSYNLATFPDANGKLSCELLPSDKYNNSDKFIYSLTFNHFSIPVGANLFVPVFAIDRKKMVVRGIVWIKFIELLVANESREYIFGSNFISPCSLIFSQLSVHQSQTINW